MNVLLVAAFAATLTLPIAPRGALSAAPLASPTAAEIFRGVEDANRAREAKLVSYTSTRSYAVWKPGHEVTSATTMTMAFTAPSTKTFTTVSETGVGWIQKRVFHRLMEAERTAAAGQEKAGSALSSANYDVRLTGEDKYRDRDCYVMDLEPKRNDKYLFKGRIWVDKEDLAIAKLDGEPVASPSFWITRAPFVREYQRVQGFWLPLRDVTHTQVRLVGEYVLQIDYGDYHVDALP